MEKLKDIFSYFFGQGQEVEFKNFTLAHFLPIIIMAIIIYLVYRYREKIREFKHEKTLRMILAFALIICEMSYYWRLVGIQSLNPNPHEHLPITICGWVVVFSSYMLVSKSQSLFDLSYFWALSGSIFALITPTVISYCGPTRFRYYQFWGEHLFGYLAIFYMIFVHKMRPTVKSFVRAYGWLVVLAFVAFMANQMLGSGANYLFMAELEETTSLLNILPKNFVLKILIMAAAVSILFAVSYLPWFFKDKKKLVWKIDNED